MEYYFIAWTFWAIALAMHAIWWAWIAPNINTKLRTEHNVIWQYFHWLPYVTTLSLLFWPFLALDKIQNWSPTDTKAILTTIGIFTLVAVVIFAFITKLVSCKDCPKLFGDKAARVSMGHSHKIQKSFAPHGSVFFLANLLGMSVIYSFVISPSHATARQQELFVEIISGQSFAGASNEIQSNFPSFANNNSRPTYSTTTNSIDSSNFASAPMPNDAEVRLGLGLNTANAQTDNSNRIVGPDGKIIEGEIIGRLETTNRADAKPSSGDNSISQNTYSQNSFTPSENRTAELSVAGAAPNSAANWQLVETSRRASSETPNVPSSDAANSFLGSSNLAEQNGANSQ